MRLQQKEKRYVRPEAGTLWFAPASPLLDSSDDDEWEGDIPPIIGGDDDDF
jgi:hypothetical protein